MNQKLFNIYISYPTQRTYGMRIINALTTAFANRPQFRLSIKGSHIEQRNRGRATISFDGMIGVFGPKEFENYRLKNIPIVYIDDYYQEAEFFTIASNNQKIAQMAHTYFKDKGFQNFGFITHNIAVNAKRILEELQELCIDNGHQLYHMNFWDSPSPFQKHCVDWLKRLPSHTALLCQDDNMAEWSQTLIERAERSIPDDIAVMGIGNDETITATFNPPLTSIELNAEKIATLAAEYMEQALLHNKPIKPGRVNVDPISVIERASTNRYAIQDADVLRALELIHAHADQPYQVKDILKDMPIGRRLLERKFRATLHRSIHDEIRIVHINRAKDLLLNTNLKLVDIALRCGYSNAGALSRVFRELNGQNPGQWRRANRPKT